MALVRVGGVDVAYTRKGRGPLVVLAHGAGADGRMWQPQVEALADEFTVVSWDEPGSGRSGELPPGFGLADFARALAAVIEDVGLGPAQVAGLSWGGTVVLELYRWRPDLVKSLLMVDTYAGWKGSLPPEEVAARVEGARRMLAAPREEFDPTLPGLYAAGPPERFAPVLDAMSRDVRPETMAAQLSLMAEADETDPAAPDHGADPPPVGRARRPLSPGRRPRLPGGDPTRRAGGDPRSGPREQPGGTGGLHGSSPHLLPRAHLRVVP
ncbi:alpha/beta fold hydrolase [Streptomyces narbonensis]